MTDYEYSLLLQESLCKVKNSLYNSTLPKFTIRKETTECTKASFLN